MAREFAKALTQNEVSADLKYFKDATHRSIMRQLHSEKADATKAVLDFVKRATR